MKKSIIFFAAFLMFFAITPTSAETTVSYSDMEIKSYTELNYDAMEIPTDGDTHEYEIKENEKFFSPIGDRVTGKAFHFDAEEGREYMITCNFKTNRTYDSYYSGFYLLHSGDLTGNYEDDVIVYHQKLDQQVQNLTVTCIYKTDISGKLKLLVYDNWQQEYEVFISIEELSFITYTDIDYSREVSVNSGDVYGILSDKIRDFWDAGSVAAGHSFQAQAGMTYKITVNFKTDKNLYLTAGFAILTENLTGNINDDHIETYISEGYGNELTVVELFPCNKTGMLRILLFRHYMSELDYSISIKEVPKKDVKLYTDIDYSQQITVDGDAIEGTLSELVRLNSTAVCANGLSFQAHAGKKYIIDVNYIAEKNARIEAHCFILTSKNLTGNLNNDNIKSYFQIGNRTVTIRLFFTCVETGMFRVLLADLVSQNESEYFITIKEEISYTELDYSQQIIVGGDAVTGSLYREIRGWGNYMATVAGLSFQAQAGKYYQITTNYKADTNVEMAAGCLILTGGNMTGNYNDDFIQKVQFYVGRGTLTINEYFTSSETGMLRILLSDHALNELEYSISIREVKSYAELDYSHKITTNDAAVTGILSKSVIFPWGNAAAVGYSFDSKPGKYYQITCTLTAEQEAYMRGYLSILTGDKLTGTDSDWIDGYGFMRFLEELEFSFRVRADGNILRILLYDIEYNELKYSISVMELNSYSDLDYSQQVIVGGDAVTGLLSKSVISPLSNDANVNAAGLSFNTESGKWYQISCTFTAKQAIFMDVCLSILTGGELQGNYFDDRIKDDYNWGNSNRFVCSLQVRADGNMFRILLFDREQIELDYSISIKEVGLHITNSPEVLRTNPLHAWVQNGQLHISGLAQGNLLSVYSASGVLVYRNVAESDKAYIVLKTQGIYIVKSGDNTVKVVF